THRHTLPHSTHFSSLTLSRPPTSTLFPYTTLFRSRPLVPRPIELVQDLEISWAIVRPEEDAREEQSASHGEGPRRSAVLNHVGLDRKSTRLNSSHVSISYAVFCLKKKSNRRIRCDG